MAGQSRMWTGSAGLRAPPEKKACSAGVSSASGLVCGGQGLLVLVLAAACHADERASAGQRPYVPCGAKRPSRASSPGCCCAVRVWPWGSCRGPGMGPCGPRFVPTGGRATRATWLAAGVAVVDQARPRAVGKTCRGACGAQGQHVAGGAPSRRCCTKNMNKNRFKRLLVKRHQLQNQERTPPPVAVPAAGRNAASTAGIQRGRARFRHPGRCHGKQGRRQPGGPFHAHCGPSPSSGWSTGRAPGWRPRLRTFLQRTARHPKTCAPRTGDQRRLYRPGPPTMPVSGASAASSRHDSGATPRRCCAVAKNHSSCAMWSAAPGGSGTRGALWRCA